MFNRIFLYLLVISLLQIFFILSQFGLFSWFLSFRDIFLFFLNDYLSICFLSLNDLWWSCFFQANKLILQTLHIPLCQSPYIHLYFAFHIDYFLNFIYNLNSATFVFWENGPNSKQYFKCTSGFHNFLNWTFEAFY